MATFKQRVAFNEVVKGSPISRAMVKANYATSTSQRTNKLTRTKGWKELVELHLSDKDLAKKHNEQLNSSKLTKLYFEMDDEDEDIENVCKKLGVELLYVKTNKDRTGKTANVKAPDFFFRDLALDKAYKLKGRYEGKEGEGNKTLVLVITGETAQRYGVTPNGISKESSS